MVAYEPPTDMNVQQALNSPKYQKPGIVEVVNSIPSGFGELEKKIGRRILLADSGMVASDAGTMYAQSKAYGAVAPTTNIHEYYTNTAQYVNNSKLPSKLKVKAWRKGAIHSTKLSAYDGGKISNFENGSFTSYFFDLKYHEAMRDVFKKDGYSPDKIERFFSKHRNEWKISLFNGSKNTYLILADDNERCTYFLPLSPKAIEKILKL